MDIRFIGYWFLTCIVYILTMKYIYIDIDIGIRDIEKFLIISGYIWYMIMLLEPDAETQY
jgi:hypothetical protein